MSDSVRVVVREILCQALQAAQADEVLAEVPALIPVEQPKHGEHGDYIHALASQFQSYYTRLQKVHGDTILPQQRQRVRGLACDVGLAESRRPAGLGVCHPASAGNSTVAAWRFGPAADEAHRASRRIAGIIGRFCRMNDRMNHRMNDRMNDRMTCRTNHRIDSSPVFA